MKIYLLIIGLVAGIFSCLAQDSNVWSSRSPIPLGRGFTSGAVVDGKIYIIGGFPDHYSVTASVQMYDPGQDTWSEMHEMPEARCAMAVCVNKRNIYVFGGIAPNGYATAKNNIFVYDPENDSWTVKNPMPFEMAFCGIAAVEDTIYIMGGAKQLFTRLFQR
jgi:N-acetylneuraminic acid mutarotase